MEAFLKGYKPGSSGVKPPKISESKQQTVPKKPVPWVEKYRPKTVNDVAAQQEVVAVLKKTLEGADLPNLLFYGPPGTGKTSTILALAREMFGDMYKTRILELNASDERGIQVVRDKIKTFSQLSASATGPDGKACPPFKIIILDEADSMTSAAQAALRRTMEKETKTTRFCIICNYITRIIEPLTSRCSKFRFKPLAKEILTERLAGICKKEGVDCEPGVLEAFVDVCEGDLRKAITLLQSTARLRQGSTIRITDVSETAGVIPDDWIEKFFTVCRSNSYDKLQAYVKDLIWEGYTASQLILQVHDRVIVAESDFTDKQKSIIAEKLAVCDFRLLEGADEYLQVLDLANVVMDQCCRPT